MNGIPLSMIVKDVRRKLTEELLLISWAHGHMEERDGALDRMSSNGLTILLTGSIIRPPITYVTGVCLTGRSMFHKIRMVAVEKSERTFG